MLRSASGLLSFDSQRSVPATDHCLDRFYFVQRIGEGGFGAVFEAVDMRTGEFVALKIPKNNQPRTLADFRREFVIARRFEHPNVVPILDIVTTLGSPVLVYPLAQTSVTTLIDGDQLAPARAFQFAGQLLDGLAHVHQRGYIHCDLKPDNLLVFPGDRVALTDFGLARLLVDDCVPDCYSGTEDYMAPEHAIDGRVSTRSDVYEAALVIIEMLTGAVPERPLEDAPLDPLLEQLSDGRPSPPWIRALEPVMQRALSLDPRLRYADAAAMACDFHRRAGADARQTPARVTPRTRSGEARLPC